MFYRNLTARALLLGGVAVVALPAAAAAQDAEQVAAQENAAIEEAQPAADESGELGEADDVNSFGTGFRYLIARRYGFVMGVDVARGPDETAVYLQAGSVW